jgi:MFS family permease
MPRRRVIEGGLLALGAFLAAMALSGRISSFLGNTATRTGVDLSLISSLLTIVVAVAFFAGVAYAAVAIPAQTQLQEDLPEDVRGRVFGVLNMLVSVASFLPILIVGPIADWLGTTIVLVIVAILIGASGIASIYLRGPLRAVEREVRATVGADRDPFVSALGVDTPRRNTGDDDLPDIDGSREAGPVVLPAADPITAAESTLDADAVTRAFARRHRPQESASGSVDPDDPDAAVEPLADVRTPGHHDRFG